MRKIQFYIPCLLVFFSFNAYAVELNDFGAGIQLGDPSGISVKFGKTSKNSVHAVFGWHDDVDFHIHADYLWNHGRLFNLDRQVIDAYFGIGARVQDRDDDYWHDHHRHHHHDDDDFAIGARFPGGLRWLNNPKNLEVYVELAAVMDVLPDTDGEIDFGIGFNFFF